MPQPDIATIADLGRVHAVKRPDVDDWVTRYAAEHHGVTTGSGDVT